MSGLIRKTFPGFSVALLISAAPFSSGWAQGGWLSQTFQLSEGWNAIWIDVDPVPSSPELLLAGLDYERISTFLPSRSPGDRGLWASYLENRPPYVSTLQSIEGKRGYFINVNSPGTLTIMGRPLNRGVSFSGRGGNLFGANFDPGFPPTFAQALSDPNLTGKNLRIFELNNESGEYDELSMNDPMESGVAYILTVSQDVDDIRPFSVRAPVDGLQFGAKAYSRVITLDAPVSTNPRTFLVRYFPSAPPPPGEPGDSAVGDETWLQYRRKVCLGGPNDGQFCSDSEGCPEGLCINGDWMDFGAEGLLLTLPAGQAIIEFEIRCVRAGRGPTTSAKGGTESFYQGLLEIADFTSLVKTVLGTGMEILPSTGLFIGQARLASVNTTEATGGLEDAPNLAVPLILSLPESATEPKRLLDQTSVMIRRDGRDLERQFISVLFPEPVDLTESAPLTGNGTAGVLTGTQEISADHPLNPYRHQYHPEHTSGYDITRDIELTFSATVEDASDSIRDVLADYHGENRLVGTYTETITGLSIEPIVVQGAFTLVRLSDTTDLGEK